MREVQGEEEGARWTKLLPTFWPNEMSRSNADSFKQLLLQTAEEHLFPEFRSIILGCVRETERHRSMLEMIQRAKRRSGDAGQADLQLQRKEISISMEEAEPVTLTVKEEEKELSVAKDPGLAETNPVSVKTEDEGAEASFLKHNQNTNAHVYASSSTDHLKCDDGVDACEPDAKVDPLFQCKADQREPPSSDSDTDNSEDWDKSNDQRAETMKKSGANHACANTGEKPFSCSVCNKAFPRQRSLENHMASHTGEKRYSCDICNKRFVWQSQIYRHKCVGWSDPKVKVVREQSLRCPECGKSYSNHGNLTMHRQTHTGEKPFSCSECGKSFGLKGDLKKHIQIHSGVKHDCPVCNKSCNTSLILRRHMARMHAEEKGFTCSVCKKSFAQRYDYNRHVASHTGERPFTCSVCYKSFKSKAALKGHIGEHTGVKPFTCSICGKGVVSSSVLKEHMKIHSGEKPHSCSRCGKCFRMRSDLNKHFLLHSGKKK